RNAFEKRMQEEREQLSQERTEWEKQRDSADQELAERRDAWDSARSQQETELRVERLAIEDARRRLDEELAELRHNHEKSLGVQSEVQQAELARQQDLLRQERTVLENRLRFQ